MADDRTDERRAAADDARDGGGGDAGPGEPGGGPGASGDAAPGSGASRASGADDEAAGAAGARAAGRGAARGEGDASREGGPRERAERTWGETLHGVQEAVGDMVGEVLDGVRDVAVGRRFPRVDVVRVEGEGYRVFVDLPGVQKEHLEVTTLGNELTVAGRRPPQEIPDAADVLRSERGHGGFRRSVRLPADAREDEVRATLEDGVLVVRVPLAEPGDAQRVEID